MQLSFDAADRLVELVQARRGPVGAEEAARVLYALERAPAALARSLLADVVVGDARLAWRRRLEVSHRWLAAATWAFVLPALAIQLGWATAEIGRQPWIVYGLMRTADGVSPIVSAPEVLASLLGFGLVYLVLGLLWLFLLRRMLVIGPEPGPEIKPAEVLP